MNERTLSLFAGTDLAERIENAERTMISEGAEAARRREPGGRAFALPLAGGVAAWAGEGSPLNKVAGMGFGGAPDEAELEAVERAYAKRDTPVQVELSTAGDPAIGAILTRRGYVLVGFENVLALSLEPGRKAVIARGVEVRDSPMSELDQWLDLVVTGFASPDTQGVASYEEFPRDLMDRAMRDLNATSGLVRSIALHAGIPAGGASLRLHAGIAQLCGTATLPALRRRGVHSSLLEARLAAAAASGAEVAVVTTQPGSKSQQNVQRQGFELIYARAVLVRES
jgi:GNAT superfamily N-acetyltransferase